MTSIKTIYGLAFIISLTFFSSPPCLADAAAVVLKEVYGAVKQIQAEEKNIKIAQVGEVIKPQDKIVTMKGGSAVIQAGEQAEIELNENTTWQLAKTLETESEGKISSELLIGELKARISKMKEDSLFEIRTPTAVAVVRGTEFQLRVYQIQGEVYTHVYVSDGVVIFSDLSGENVSQLAAGQSAVSAPVTASDEMAARSAMLQAGGEKNREDLELSTVIEMKAAEQAAAKAEDEAKVNARIL